MRHQLRQFLSICFIAAVIVGVQVSKASALEKITHVDCGLVPSFSVVWVGVDAGIFKKNGLDVNTVTAQSTAACVQSMLAGEAQVGNPETVAGLIANQNGASFVNIMNYQKTILYEMFVRSEIKSAQDLKGKKMGINRFGATAEAMSRIMLKNLGLDPHKDMSFIQVGGGQERALALMNNAVQASLFSPPEPVKLAKEPSLRRFATLSDQNVEYPYLNLVTTRNYLKDRRDIIRNFVRGYLESLKFYATSKTAIDGDYFKAAADHGYGISGLCSQDHGRKQLHETVCPQGRRYTLRICAAPAEETHHCKMGRHVR